MDWIPKSLGEFSYYFYGVFSFFKGQIYKGEIYIYIYIYIKILKKLTKQSK